MINKERDVEYCGVDRYKIERSNPTLIQGNLQLFVRMVEERYKIHLHKDVEKEPAPWTDDIIMSIYKFTNVRREHDRQSRYLIDNIVKNPILSLKEKMANIILFRAFNNWSTMRDLGGPWDLGSIYNVEGMKEQVRPILAKLKEENPKRCLWSSAYIQSGSKMSWLYPSGLRKGLPGEEKEEITELRPFHIGGWLKVGEAVNEDVLDRCLNAPNQEEVYHIIKELPGFADFLAYQVFVDFTYIPEFPFSENEFTVAGPGCKRGLNILFKDRDGMSYEECLFWLRNNLPDLVPSFNPEKFMYDLPKHDRVMNVMSLENCFCEFSKYFRAYNHEGRPRNKYTPTKVMRNFKFGDLWSPSEKDGKDIAIHVHEKYFEEFYTECEGYGVIWDDGHSVREFQPARLMPRESLYFFIDASGHLMYDFEECAEAPGWKDRYIVVEYVPEEGNE